LENKYWRVKQRGNSGRKKASDKHKGLMRKEVQIMMPGGRLHREGMRIAVKQCNVITTNDD
jgi:hypothetical protein